MMKSKSTFLMAVVMCGAFTLAYADVKYTRVTKTTFPKTVSRLATDVIEKDTFFVTPDKMREEIGYPQDKNSPPTNEVFITRCDKEQVFTIDDNLKIYSVSPRNKEGIPKSLIADDPVPKDIPEEKTVINFSIQKLAPRKINGFDTQCYSIVTSMQGSGYAGSAKKKIWIADVPGWQGCDSEKPPYAPSIIVLKTPKGDVRSTIVNTGDVDEMNKISTEFTVRLQGTFITPLGPGTGTSDVNVTSFERIKKLDDSLFEVPVGYRKVSTKEFYKLQSQVKKETTQESKKPNAQQ